MNLQKRGREDFPGAMVRKILPTPFLQIHPDPSFRSAARLFQRSSLTGQRRRQIDQPNELGAVPVGVVSLEPPRKRLG